MSSACNTLPVGYDQLRDRVTGAADTTLVPDTSDGYARYVPLGGASMLYLGRDTSYQSRILVRFSIPDTMVLDSITGFQLVLHQSDTLATMSFICRPCSSEWVETGVSWQMSDSVNHWMSPGGDFLPDTVATGTVAGDSITIDFKYVGLDSAHRATIRNYGVGIFPQDTGIVAIHSGATAAKAPRLRVTYTNKGKETKRVISDIADASLIDTIATHSNLRDLLVGSGVAFRTWLLFNIDSIPAEATIARADLKFRPEMKYHRADAVVLGVHRLIDSFPEKGANARFEELPIGSTSYLVPADSDTVITIDIRSLVQLWTGRSDTLRNYGLLIEAAPEWAPLFRLRIPRYGENAPRLEAAPEWSPLFRLRIPRSGENAPRLEVQYVLPPEDRFR